MTIASRLTQLAGIKADIKTALIAQGQSVGDDMTAYAAAISNIEGGGSSEGPDDVTFYDYDGTVVASYSMSDFAALSAMPSNPIHAGLTSQGWNWSLSDAKTYVAKYGKLNIGQMYITDDGKTRLYITIRQTTELHVGVVFYQSLSEGVEIDWGDGSAIATRVGSGTGSLAHVYSTIGSYVISMEAKGNCELRLGDGSYSGVLGGYGATNARYNYLLQKVELGNGISELSSSVFRNCGALSSITVPNAAWKWYSGVFEKCYSLTYVTIPPDIDTSYTDWFSNCRSLKTISLPNSQFGSMPSFTTCCSLTSICLPDALLSVGDVFDYCEAMSYLVIPENVTNITRIAPTMNNGSNFGSLREIHIKPTTPPTLSNGSSLLPSGCLIYVPASSLEAYKVATNWSAYSSIMVGE